MKNTYKVPKMTKSEMKSVETKQGITKEQQVARIMDNQADMERTAPLIYTERKEGVNSAYNIRTDRFEIANEAMEKGTKSALAERENRAIEKENKLKLIRGQEDGKPDSVQGTE